MTNEVTKATEETAKPEDSVTEEKIEENSADQTAETITAETTEEAAESQPDEKTAEAKASESEDEKAAKVDDTPTEDETVENNPVLSDEETTKDENQLTGDIDFGAILEEFEQDQEEFRSGMLVEGKVVGVSEREVLVNFGYKSEGVVPSDEFTSTEGKLDVKVGDDVEVVIKNIYSGDSPPVLSRQDAVHRKSWDLIEDAYNNEDVIKGKVISKTKGGLRVDIEGVEAFLPGSQVDSRPIRNLDSFIGEEIEAKVIKFSRKRNNIVISRKILTDEVIEKLKAETLKDIEEQYIVDGVVKNLTEYGAFVDLGGIDGLLHVTDMSWGRIHNPNELFKVNDNVQVKVLKLDREKEKVSLGYKQLYPDPWSTVVEVYPVDSVVEGTVSSVTDYGAFVELEPGVEGLVHISEMSWSKRTKSPKKLVNPREKVQVQILGIDTEERRISLGMKQLQDNPWETIAERYQVGSRVLGKVRNLTDFGAFVEVEEGVDGLVHVSDISHSKKIKHPKDVLKRNQEVEAIVTNIDTEGHRLSLSIKELTPSSWDSFVETHKPGNVVKGKVSRFAGFGVFVELGEDLEGLCHISELSDERVEKPEDVVSIGQELDFKILRIEHDVQKIGLSHRAVGKDDEPIVDSRQYSTEAKGGMASLGELASLKLGSQEETEEEEEDKPKLSKKERRALRAKEKAEAGDETAEDSDSEESSAPDTEELDEPETEETKEEAVSEDAEDKSESETSDEVMAEKSEETSQAEPEETPETENESETEEKTEEDKTETDSSEEAKAEESVNEEVSEESEEKTADSSDEADSKTSDNEKDVDDNSATENDGKSDADKAVEDSTDADEGKSDAEDDGKSDADKTESDDDEETSDEDDGKSDADK